MSCEFACLYDILIIHFMVLQVLDVISSSNVFSDDKFVAIVDIASLRKKRRGLIFF